MVTLLSQAFLILFLTTGNLFAATPTDLSQKNNIDLSTAAAEKWLKLVDNEKYVESYANSSSRLQQIFPKAEWISYLQLRKALGKVKTRTLNEQLPAKDPKGLAPGEYMVITYNSTFSNKQEPMQELLTLTLEQGNKWRVLSYYFAPQQNTQNK